MKHYFLGVLFITYNLHSQVGIGTTSPTATLDINGDLRVRTIPQETEIDIAKDSVLAITRDGTMKTITSENIIKSHLRTAVRGYFASGSTVNLSLSSNKALLPFNAKSFDVNNEFDTSTYTFTAKQEGVYSIYIQIKGISSISIATDFGVTIVQDGTAIARKNYANTGVLGINVSPPERSTQTIVALAEGESIRFEVVSSLSSVSLVGNETDCFFTIQQVR